MYSNVVLAGTFDILHIGHKKLINHALKISKKLYLGITSDEFVKKNKSYKCASFEERKNNIIKFLGKRISKVEIVELNDEFGMAQNEKNLQAIVVSDETKFRAEAINEIRKRNGLKPLEIISLPIVYAEDLKKISCERIRAGEIDANGKRLKGNK
jgi:pantetheine-phosphate adenylyltransferase